MTYFLINICLGLIPATLFLLSQAHERDKLTATDLLIAIGMILIGILMLGILLIILLTHAIEESKDIVIWKKKNKVNPIL